MGRELILAMITYIVSPFMLQIYETKGKFKRDNSSVGKVVYSTDKSF